MRRTWAKLLYEAMRQDEKIVLLTGDLGYGMWDNIRDSYPQRFYNCGSAEQAMLGIAVGLALGGKIPICYSITPFVLCRPFEIIRNYLNHEKVPVKLVGAGRDRDYGHDGFTHWGEDDKKICECFPNLVTFRPDTNDELISVFSTILYNNRPSYVNLRR
jgi:transketolase